MSSAARPDPSLSVLAVLEEWLPQRFSALGRAMPPDCPRLRVTVKGEADLLFAPSGTDLNVSTRFSDGEAHVWVRLSAADFRALLHGDPDLPALLPAHRDLVDLMLVDAGSLDAFSLLAGRLALEITGRKRRRFTLDVAFGETGFKAGRPRSTISIEGAALESLMNGSKPPLAALIEGKVRVDGDRALAMQTLMLVAAQTSRR